MTKINIRFTLFSAFYSPLILTMAGDFLKDEGLEPDWSVSPPGTSSITALEDGSADVIQSALSQAFGPLAAEEVPIAVHFAQINEMDGFFLSARNPDSNFSWNKLEGSEAVLFAGGQPLAMFKYACHKAGIDYQNIMAINPGGPADIDKTFRDGKGTYVQQQGPFPQALEADGVGHIVAEVGPMIGPCGFSSLAATSEWLRTDMALAFMRAYRKARKYLTDAPAAEIASLEKPYFPHVDQTALTKCIDSYQKLGCWTPHVEITPDAFEATLDIFEYNSIINQRFTYEQVCSFPPDKI